MSNISIQSSAMLVGVTMRVWTAFKLDKSTTAEVNMDKNADTGVARVNKNLFKNVRELEAIKRHTRDVRKWLYDNTLPWADEGDRLLPTAAFFNFKQELNDKEKEFYDLRDAFLNKYDVLVGSQAFKMGSLFDRSEYPTLLEVAGKFDFTSSFSPLPQSGDFRVDIGTEALEALTSDYDAMFTDRFDAAVNDIKDRLMQGIKHLSQRLEYGQDGKPNVFRDTALSNVADMLSRVKVLNISGDEALAAAALEAEQVLACVTPTELRKENDARDHTKAKLDEILGKMSI